MVSFVNELFLCNYDFCVPNLGNKLLEKIWSGEWLLEDSYVVKKFLDSGLEKDALEKLIKEFLENGNSLEEIIHISVCSILTFCKQNWSSKSESFALDNYFQMKWPDNIDVMVKLQRDSEPVYVNILYPELLYFGMQIFSALYSIEQNMFNMWWYLRCKVLHQRVLEDTSATLYSELELLLAKLFNELQLLQDKPRLKALLFTEMAQVYLIYGRIQKVEEYMSKAKEIVGLKLELTGILGKRTKFQQHYLPQLALSSQLDESLIRPSMEHSHGTSELPHEVELQDDVRLNKIQYQETLNQVELPSLEQTLCLLTVQYLQKAQPKDELMAEELQPYINAVVSQKQGPWPTRAAALLVRCKLEANHKRTVERAMLQCENIVNDTTVVPNTNRLSYLWAAGLLPAWTWRQQLADLYFNLGLVKAALEEYLKLQLWEDVIVCYTMLQLRHKAAEVLLQELEKKPTVKLYCLLGDATDEETWYEKAWVFSEEKSSRAQRHWGNYLFNRKLYEQCIPHFECSLQINSLQESVWLRLGYAALMTEQWELSARAYRRYTYLQPSSFEAWNNLAKVYVKQGDKERAYRALMEALRYNYDNWKLWENVIVVSMDTGHHDDVIRGCHRLLDLQHKYEDVEVLTLLVRAVIDQQDNSDRDSFARLQRRMLELFGRITSVHQNKPQLWQLYADISPTSLLKAQRLLRAYRGYAQISAWSDNADTCKRVIELTKLLMECSLKATQEVEEKDKLQADQQLSSARLTGQAVLRTAEKKDWQETKTILDDLKTLLNAITNHMKSNVS